MRRHLALFSSLSGILVLACASPARAQVVSFSGGGGQLVVLSDPCGYEECATPRKRLVAWAPMVGIGVHASGAGERWPADGLRLRLGARGEIASIGPRAGSGGARGEIGLALGPVSADAGLGLSWIWLDHRGRDETGASLSTGLTTALRLSRDLSLGARAALHATMHSELSALIVGVTLDWSPPLAVSATRR